MLIRKIIAQMAMILSILLSAGCHQAMKVNPYTMRDACLVSVIDNCKRQGWDYSVTNPVCQRATTEGIYSLTAAQLAVCRAAAQQKKS